MGLHLTTKVITNCNYYSMWRSYKSYKSILSTSYPACKKCEGIVLQATIIKKQHYNPIASHEEEQKVH